MAGRIQEKRKQPSKKKDAVNTKLKKTPQTEDTPIGVEQVMKIGPQFFQIDPAYQMRGARRRGSHAVLDQENLTKLTILARENRPFQDPIKLVRIVNKAGGFKSCVLVDGFHRVEAMRRAGISQINAVIVREGTKRDATQEAIKANQRHGLPAQRRHERDTVKRAFMDKLHLDKNKEPIPLTEIAQELGMTASPRQIRRWVKADSPREYEKHYAAKHEENAAEETSDNTKPRRKDFALEVDGIRTALRHLIEELRHYQDEPEGQAGISGLTDALNEAQQDLRSVGDEFAVDRNEELFSDDPF